MILVALNIFQLVSTVLADVAQVQIAGAELAAGQAVEAPGHLKVGTAQGKPVYLVGVLSTDPNYQISSAPPVPASAHETTVTGVPAVAAPPGSH
jgi:hypothetical protein